MGFPEGLREESALHILHAIRHAVCIVDEGDRHCFVNRAYADQYKEHTGTLIGVGLDEVMEGDVYALHLKRLLERAREEGQSEFKGWVGFPGTGRRYHIFRMRRYTGPSRDGSGFVLMECEDRTDLIELEERRKASLATHELILDSMPAMSWLAQDGNQPCYYNAGWLKFTGLTHLEQISRGWFDQIHPDERESVKEQIESALKNRDLLGIEFRLKHLLGDYRWLRLTLVPVEEEQLGKNACLASALDINETKEREVKMSSMLSEERRLREFAMEQKAEADRANQEKSAYLSLASHEIRTPMNPVIGFADLLASNPSLDEESREMAEMILKSGRNLLTLVDEVLDYAKIEAGALNLMPEAMDIHDLLIELEQQYAYEVKSRGLEWRVQDDVETTDEFFQDRTRLHQVIGTLITHAIKSTHSGLIEIRASLETETFDGHLARTLCLCIADTGMGMDKNELENLFLPFMKAEGEFNEKYGGAGLGLAISQKLIEAMRGEITVSSEVGTGTETVIKIPFTPVPEGERYRNPDASGKQDEVVDLPVQRARVVIVDDEESSREVNRSLMKFLGYESETVGSGKELIQRLQEQKFELILLDVMMPGLDGLQVTRSIRTGEAGENNREAFIIAVTGCAQEEDSQRCLEAGVDAYVPKPLTIKNLKEAIRSFRLTLGREN
jgi:PAS domain S-box-containing protein